MVVEVLQSEQNPAEKIRSPGGKVPTLIDPTAVVSRGTVFDEGVVAKTLSRINANVFVARDTPNAFNAMISHGARVGPCCFIGPTRVVGATTTLGERVFVGASAVVGTTKGIAVGEGAVIGAGSVVTKSVAAGDDSRCRLVVLTSVAGALWLPEAPDPEARTAG